MRLEWNSFKLKLRSGKYKIMLLVCFYLSVRYACIMWILYVPRLTHCTMYWHTLPMANLPHRSWDSIVGMMTRLQAGWSGVQILVGARDFSIIWTCSYAHLELLTQWLQGFFPVSKAARAKVNHSPPPSRKVKNKWSYTPSSPLHLRYVNRQNCTFIMLRHW